MGPCSEWTRNQISNLAAKAMQVRFLPALPKTAMTGNLSKGDPLLMDRRPAIKEITVNFNEYATERFKLHSRNPADYDVVIHHDRPVKAQPVTVVVIHERPALGLRSFVGVSRLHPNDQFSRKAGREAAFENALKRLLLHAEVLYIPLPVPQPKPKAEKWVYDLTTGKWAPKKT